jgi:hypothetical protein
MVKTIGKASKDIIAQDTSEAGPALFAVIVGKTRMPQPKTAPMVSAVPCTQVIDRFNDCSRKFINPICFFLIIDRD